MLNLNKLSIDISKANSQISKNGINIINKFYRILNDENNFNSEIEFEWLKHFKLVYGDIEKNLSSNKKIKDVQLIECYKVSPNKFKSHRIFFAIQSYYALLIKLITSKLLADYKRNYVNNSDINIVMEIEDILRGDFFLKYGINNYCYEDWFTWFLDCCDEELKNLLKELNYCLELYEDEKVLLEEFDTIRNNDYIKQIYESVIPKELRHALGEYYTPDWLAEYTIDSVCSLYENEVTKLKMLDPTCGSGTFVFKAIQWFRYKNPNTTLEEIINNIKGLDINPLAVLTAKTNYLIAILDKINDLKSIEIPIYSYDVINTPKEENDIITIDIDNNIFILPSKLAYKNNVTNLKEVMKLCIKKSLSESEFIKYISSFIKLDLLEIDLMIKFYNQINAYQYSHIAMIWVNMVTNWLKAYSEKDFDVIIGNPPWINWEYMPNEYRVKSQHIWPEIGIFSAKGKDLAFSKEDVSTLITYLVIDKFLKDKGYLAFVIRQGIFKSAQNGIGFRKFKIRNEIDIRVCKIDDLVSVKPFKNATNQTAIMYLQKGVKNQYPVKYIEWKKKSKGTLRSYADLSEILKLINKVELVAKPSIEDDITSLWITVDNKLIDEFDKVLGKNNYKARTGIFSGGANAVYWMNINKIINNELVEVSNITARAKRKAENVVVNIENKYIYPLLKGSDVSIWDAKPSIYMLCPHTIETKMKPVPLEELKEEVPLTVDYLEYFKSELDDRKGFAGWEKENQKENFHSVLRVGEYTFSKYKVIWRYIASDFITAVISNVDDKYIGKKMILPNEKIMYVSTDDEMEAYYLCGILSSTPISLCVKSFMNPTSISTHVLEKLNIADFDEKNELHIKIANICKKGHLAINKDEKKYLLQEIDKIVANIYGISSSILD